MREGISRRNRLLRRHSVPPGDLGHLAGDTDADLAKGVGDLGLAEAGGVVLEGELVLLFINAKAAQAVGVGELAEAAELLEAER